MSSPHIDTFWKQLYFSCLSKYGLCVPQEPLPPLQEMRDVVKELQDDRDHASTDEPFYPTREQEQIERYLPVMEYYWKRVVEYSRDVDVPPSAMNRIRNEAKAAVEPVEEEDADAEGEESRDGIKYHRYGLTMISSDDFNEEDDKVAACNCPHCWMYTEDLVMFMEHLLEKHSIVSEGQAAEAEEQERIPDEKATETPQDNRKDSGYSDTMSVDEEAAASKDVEEPSTSERRHVCLDDTIDPDLPAPPDQRFLADKVSSPVDPKSSIEAEATATEAGSAQSMDIEFWRKLLKRPLPIRPAQPEIFAPSTSRESEAQRQTREYDERAQHIRDNLTPITWYKLKDIREASRPQSSASDGSFKLPLMRASQMKKESKVIVQNHDDVKESSFVRNYSNEHRYWICVHDEECKKRFRSLVLYTEHLTHHGLIVYKSPDEVHKTAPRLDELRWSAKGM